MTHKNSAIYPKQTLRNETSSGLDSGPPHSIIEILGVKINLVDHNTTSAIIKDGISRHARGRYICACPVYSIMVSQRDNELRMALNDSWLTVPDGMPVVWAARLLGGKIKKNVRGTDLMLLTCELAEKKNYSIYLYGGKRETLDNLEKNLQNKFPTLRILGKYSPPFRPLSPTEDLRITRMLRSASPDILFVSLGAPKQEKWMAEHCQKIEVPINIGVGAAFDFIAGEKKEAPSWVQNCGLEWLFRLLCEPGRLWKRYLVYNALFIISFSRQLIKNRLS